MLHGRIVFKQSWAEKQNLEMGIIILNCSLAFGTNKEQVVLLVSSNFWSIQSEEEFIYAEILIAASMMAVHVF